MIGLRWEKEKQYFLKERRITTRHNLVGPDDTIWASYIETEKGYEVLDLNFTFKDENNAKMECEYLVRAKIMDKIAQLQAILG